MKWLLLALTLLATPVVAVQPDEILADPLLEARARDISAGLRCPVCRNESIDESNAAVARDLRLMVRERLVAGDTDAEVVAAVVARFGEFILLKPDASGANLVLWLAPVALLLAGVGVAFAAQRRRIAVTDPLTEAEQARLTEIMRQ
jgi:cytochrome c-type biogenesis protein CcmH